MSATTLKTLAGIGIFAVFVAVGLSLRLGPDAVAAPSAESRGPSSHGDPADAHSGGTPAADGFVPAYLELHESGELAERARQLWAMMESCTLCPRSCGVNRLAGAQGFCRAPGTQLVVASVQPHFGEERPLVGRSGSGTIFFSHCNLRCVFCQNYQISILGRGNRTSIDELANAMLQLQAFGSHNINVVTPTHYTPHIVAAIDVAAARGLRVPIVWNTSGWERVEVLRLLDGIVDIYLPDMKFASSVEADQFARSPGYPEETRRAVLEMHRQVGVARPDSEGIVTRGLMIRHLVMPDSASGSKETLDWIAGNLPLDTYVNIMEQYTPHHEAFSFPRIARRVTTDEYRRVVDHAQRLGLTNLDSRTARWLSD